MTTAAPDRPRTDPGLLRAGDPEPAPGTIWEIGSRPEPARGFAGDLLTFTRLRGSGEWIRQHNWSPRVVPTTFAEVEFWAIGTLRRVDTPVAFR